jgi:hypothetical protein
VAAIRRLLTPYDIALGLVVLVAGLLSLYWVGMAGAASAGTLRIEIEGRLVAEYTFQATDPPRTIVVQAPRGPIGLELREGRVRVLPLPADICPLGICWNSGWTSHPAKAIVCLPNRMVVRILRVPGGVDGITR